MLVKRLVTSEEARDFMERFTFLNWEAKEKVSQQDLSLGSKGK